MKTKRYFIWMVTLVYLTIGCSTTSLNVFGGKTILLTIQGEPPQSYEGTISFGGQTYKLNDMTPKTYELTAHEIRCKFTKGAESGTITFHITDGQYQVKIATLSEPGSTCRFQYSRK